MISLEFAMNLLVSLILLSAIFLFAQLRFTSFVRLFAFQSFCLALLAAVSAASSSEWHLYISAILTIALKVIFLPLVLRRIASQTGGVGKLESSMRPASLLISAVFVSFVTFSLFKSHVILPQTPFFIITASIIMVLLGFLMMITRHDIFSQIIAFFLLENALFTFGLSLSGGMPLIVELGIFFDATIAAILLAALSYKIHSEHSSIRTSVLNKLID